MKKISKAVGRTEQKVGKAIEILEAKQVISKEARQRKNGVGVYNEYNLVRFRIWWKNVGKSLRDKFRKDKLKKYRK